MNPYHDELGRFTSAYSVSHYSPSNSDWYKEASKSDSNSYESIDVEGVSKKEELFCKNLSWYFEQNKDAEVFTYINEETGEVDFIVASIDAIYAQTMANDGLSFDTSIACEPKDGYMVSGFPEFSEWMDSADEPRKIKRTMRSWIKEHADLLSKPNYHLGTWINDEGKLCLDISERITDRKTAISLGEERNEQSVFDVKNGVSIPTGGTGTNI